MQSQEKKEKEKKKVSFIINTVSDRSFLEQDIETASLDCDSILDVKCQN